MLLKPMIASSPSAALVGLVDLANVASQAAPRTYTAATNVVAQYPWPGPSPKPDDATRLHGAWANNYPPVTIPAGGGVWFFFLGYTKDDPLVWVDSVYTHKAWKPKLTATGFTHEYVDVQTKGSIGNNGAPFDLPDGADTHAVNTNDPDSPPGTLFRAQHNLTYESGATAVVEYTYRTDGVAPSKPADDTGPPPPAPTPVGALPLHSLDGTAPQVLQDTKTMLGGTQTAFGDTVGAGAAVFQSTGNHVQAVLTEMNAISSQIVEPWKAIADDGAAPANLRTAARQNFDFAFRSLLDLTRIGHNAQSDQILAQVDANFDLYRQYGNYAWTRSADTILGISDWIAAGRPA